MEITQELVQKVLDVVSAGLIKGKGEPIPGQMCVEAAVCYAMGLPYDDNPPCVGDVVRCFKITLNDSHWSSDQARAKGMLALSIAQLGSNEIDQLTFHQIVSRETIRLIVPIALRNAAKKNPKYADKLEEAAKQCEEEPTAQSARKARKIAYAADYAAGSADYAAAYAAGSADYAANAAADYTARTDDNPDSIFELSARIGLEALKELNSPGCKYLYLIK